MMDRMNKKLLIVDDEPEVLAMFAKFLTRKGYGVSTARDALEALRHCKREKPDLILTDYSMPGMNGVELLKELHLTYPGLPAILMSGEADMRTAADALREQAFDFLRKPIDSNELLSSITLALQEAKDHPETQEFPADAGRVVGPVYAKRLEERQDIVILSLNRALDQHSQQAYESAFRRLNEDGELTRSIVMTMNAVPYINNVGLSMLLQTYDHWRSQGKRTVFTQLSDPVHRYLKMLGYVGYFPVVASVEEAVLSLG
jgi:anti-anti-sigma factor